MSHISPIGRQDDSYQQLIDQSERMGGTYGHNYSYVESEGNLKRKQRAVFTTASIISLVATFIIEAAWIAILVMVLLRWHGWDKASTSDKIYIICGPLIITVCVGSQIRYFLLWRKSRKGVRA